MDNDDLLIIAGKGEYPYKLLSGARKAGVKRIGVMAFRGQTSRSLCALADVSVRLGVGEFEKMLKWAEENDFHNLALAGQISPSALFSTRFDATARSILSTLRTKCAHSVFGTVIEFVERRGFTIIPASSYMDDCIPSPGVLTSRAPDEREVADIERGHAAAMTIGVVDVGQTVVVKDGMVFAVEAFEGTNAAIKRGGKLAGKNAVVVKAARDGHDMRFDIPVIGTTTIRRMIRSRISALAFQAGRVILLNRDEVISTANRHGIAIVALDSGLPPAPTRP